MRYTTTAHAFFLQPPSVPSSFSVNNRLCPVNQTHTSILETRARDGGGEKKDVRHKDTTVCWVLARGRASFPRDRGAAAFAHKHTHTFRRTHTHTRARALHTLRLELRVPVFTKEPFHVCMTVSGPAGPK